MRTHRVALALPVALALAACQPGAAEYTKTEAPTQLRVDPAESQVVLAFARGSARLSPGESARLHNLVRSGAIRPDDRVVISASGGPHLAGLRELAISHELLHYGIVADSGMLTGVPPNKALLIVGRYVVTLPICPNWSEQPFSDFTNQTSSNYGCADRTDLGLMVASPSDLVSGETLEAADATPAIAAVNRYLTDKVLLPPPAGGAAALGGALAPAPAAVGP